MRGTTTTTTTSRERMELILEGKDDGRKNFHYFI